jgi:hypothetical protein
VYDPFRREELEEKEIPDSLVFHLRYAAPDKQKEFLKLQRTGVAGGGGAGTGGGGVGGGGTGGAGTGGPGESSTKKKVISPKYEFSCTKKLLL